MEDDEADIVLWGSASQSANVSQGDLESIRDQTEAERVHRLKMSLTKLVSEKPAVKDLVGEEFRAAPRLPVEIEPFVYVAKEDELHSLTRRDMLRGIAHPTDAFSAQYASRYSASLFESVLADMVTRSCNNMELGSLSNQELLEFEDEHRSKSSDDAWLRGPRKALGERPCAKGAECECLRHFKLEAVERPSDEELHSLPPGEPYSGPGRLCVMCQRYVVLKLYVASMQRNSNVLDIRPEFHNSVGLAGEYSLEQCIVAGGSSNNAPLYSAMHLTDCYRVQWISEGEYRFAQTGYVDPARGAGAPFV